MSKFSNIALRYKLILGFLLIVVVNGLSGLFELSLIKELGGLVRQTYDRALMSGTFALAAKYDFAQYNVDVQSALLAETPEEFRLAKSKSSRILKTLKEDLEVFKERSLSPTSAELVNDLQKKIIEVDKSRLDLFRRKELFLSSNNGMGKSALLVREWGNNTDVKSIYRALTAGYDDAAELGYKFRLESDERIEKATKLTLSILAFCLILSLFLSIVLSLIIIKPLSKLEAYCREIAGGNFSIRSSITGKDEFGTLSSVFNLMLGNIDDKTQSMSSLLNTIPFALFYFDHEGKISTERSISTNKLLPGFDDHKTLGDFYAFHGHDVHDLQNVQTAMFENLIPFNSASYLLPKIIKVGAGHGQKIISLSYYPKRNSSKKLEQVIIVGEDITEKERAKLRTQELVERVERVSKVSADLPGFKDFTIVIENLFGNIKKSKDKTEIMRDLHSIKGLLGVYNFDTIAKKIHYIETLMSQSDELTPHLEEVESLFFEQVKDLNSILALSNQDNITYFDNKKIQKLKEEILVNGDVRLTKIVQELNRFPFSKVFTKFTSHVKNTAEKFEDKLVEIVIEDSDDVSYEEIKRIDPVLIHVLNNSIDHGIESAEDRINTGKSETGTIRVKCIRNLDSSLKFFISDDGKGIDGELLFNKAIQSGLLAPTVSMSMEEKKNLVFSSGLSSKSESSIISGRGVGLDAVKAHIESIGGSIRLESTIGSGTIFELQVPTELGY